MVWVHGCATICYIETLLETKLELVSMIPSFHLSVNIVALGLLTANSQFDVVRLNKNCPNTIELALYATSFFTTQKFHLFYYPHAMLDNNIRSAQGELHLIIGKG